MQRYQKIEPRLPEVPIASIEVQHLFGQELLQLKLVFLAIAQLLVRLQRVRLGVSNFILGTFPQVVRKHHHPQERNHR